MAKNPKEVAGGDMENDREAGMLLKLDGWSTPPHAPRDKPITAEQVALAERTIWLRQRFEKLERRDREARRHEELARREERLHEELTRREGEKPVQETQADHRKAELCGTNKLLQNLVSRAIPQNHGVQKYMETLDLLLKREHLDPPPDYKPFPSLAHEFEGTHIPYHQDCPFADESAPQLSPPMTSRGELCKHTLIWAQPLP